MVLVSQTSDQVEDTADLTINPTFDSSQSDCGFRAVTFSGPYYMNHIAFSYHQNRLELFYDNVDGLIFIPGSIIPRI